VAVGAILSDYQRVRVENVCSRLNLISLAYLWRRDQTELLQEMIDCQVHAIIIKVLNESTHSDSSKKKRKKTNTFVGWQIYKETFRNFSNQFLRTYILLDKPDICRFHNRIESNSISSAELSFVLNLAHVNKRSSCSAENDLFHLNSTSFAICNVCKIKLFTVCPSICIFNMYCTQN